MLIVSVAAVLLVSCASAPVAPPYERIEPSARLSTELAGVADGRGRFREIFKAVLAARCRELPSDVSCNDEKDLWKVDGETPPTGKPVDLGPSKGAFRVVAVPGLLAECVADKSKVFGDSLSKLEKFGYKTSYIQTRGRKGSDSNAALIRDAVAAMPGGEKLIFVTHSKGTVDTLEALANYPSVAERTAAVISFSGAVKGSPLADVFPGFLLELVHKIPLASCPPGEGTEAVESLRRNVRLSWLATHPLPKTVRYYSLAAFALRQNTCRLLRPFYDILAKTDPLNDGMVIAPDAIIPGSVLLGFPNADHYAVAMPFSKKTSPVLAMLIDKNNYPRRVLLEAAVRFAEEDLAGEGSSEE